MSINKYIQSIREAIERLDVYGFAESIDIREEIRAGKQAVIKIKVVLVDSSSLHIKKYVDYRYKMDIVSYAYQYQDANGGLIFRYDNAAHRPVLGFQNHKHISNGNIVEAELPNISDIIDEVIGNL